MWRYVGQRLKDSAEQTCSHLKNLRSTFSTCDTKTNDDYFQNHQHQFRRLDINEGGRIYSVWTSLNQDVQNRKNGPKKNSFDIDTPYIIQKCYQKQKHKQQDAFNGWIELNLLQWVSEMNWLNSLAGIFQLFSHFFRRLEFWPVCISVK